ncbi:hypothetical protein GCM10028818_54000 [Spirosoma horti]
MLLAQALNDNSDHSNTSSESDSGEGPETVTVSATRPTPAPSSPRGGRDGHGHGSNSKPNPTKYTLLDTAGYFDKDKDIFTNLVNLILLGQSVEKFNVEQIFKVLDGVSAAFKFIDLGVTFSVAYDNGNYKNLFQKSTTLLISSGLSQTGIVLGATPAGFVFVAAGLGYAFFDIATHDGEVLSDKVYDWATSGGIRLKSPTWDNYMGVPPY